MTQLSVLLQSVIPQHGLSRAVGWLADLSRPVWLKNAAIRAFSRAYGIALDDYEGDSADDWRSFNEFFTRALKPGARPLAATPYVQPADGLLSQCGVVESGRLVQAKGRWYTAQGLLAGSEAEAARFAGGSFMTTYLSPRDYHRVHMPAAGRLMRTRYVPGDLFAVNQHTAAGVEGLYARNERLVCFFDTEHGEMAVVLVGAVIVAGISTVWDGRQLPAPGEIVERSFENSPLALEAGDELGRFYLGSTVVCLFPGVDLDWSVPAGSEVRVNAPLASQSSSP